jgi:DNA-binding NarL/FixJ family response regulator
VRTYVRQIYRRMGVHNRVALVHATRAETAPRWSADDLMS